MELRIVGTGSAGNCYILHSKNEALIIDCGMPFKDIKASLNYDLSNVVGCLVDHSHFDHSKAMPELLKAGIKCYSSSQTHRQLVTNYYSCAVNIENEVAFNVGNFTVLPFDVKHDVQNFGFLIHHEDCGNVLFLTDLAYCEYTFPNLNQIIIEANYCPQKLENSSYMAFLQDRVIKSHMSIEQTKATLKANDLSEVNNIVLIHLSNSNADGERFRNEVFYQTGKTTHVAKAGMKIDFSLNPF